MLMRRARLHQLPAAAPRTLPGMRTLRTPAPRCGSSGSSGTVVSTRIHSMTFSDESLNGLCGFVRTTGYRHEHPACAGAHPARGAPTAMNPRRCWRRGARLDAGRRVCARADRFVSAMASQAFCRWLSATYRDVSFPQPLATRAGYHRRPDGHRAATPDIGAATTTSRLRGPRSSHFLCLGGPAPAPSCDLPPSQPHLTLTQHECAVPR